MSKSEVRAFSSEVDPVRVNEVLIATTEVYISPWEAPLSVHEIVTPYVDLRATHAATK
jgi:hypothetical protein